LEPELAQAARIISQAKHGKNIDRKLIFKAGILHVGSRIPPKGLVLIDPPQLLQPRNPGLAVKKPKQPP
jgi:hypothetical protein